tara:strand:+ start:703 stop:984 length:282 start_codon:yes stop_codon:yes gene_type:complete
MKIKFIKPGAFIKHNNEFGVTLVASNNDAVINFFDEYGDHRVVKAQDVEYPTDVELQNELLLNLELRELALDNNLIEIDTWGNDYLSLIKSFA